MRLIPTAILCAALAVPGLAHAQTKKVEGASAAGLCASSLEFVAGVRGAAGVSTPQEMVGLQQTRDMFLAVPHFKKGEVGAYANAWSERMARDMGRATTAEQKAAVAKEISVIARGCQNSMVREVNAARAAGVLPQPQQPGAVQPGTIQPTPQPLPAQPLNTQPLQAQPLDTQPLTTQPLVITPQ